MNNKPFIQDVRVKAIGTQSVLENKMQYLYYVQVKICWIWWTVDCYVLKKDAMSNAAKIFDCE